jgi:hypothetical protein
MHAASHTFQYPKVTPVAPGTTTGAAKPAAAPSAAAPPRPAR